MTAESLERIESLQNLLDSTLETFDSAKKLLDINEQLLKSVNSSENAPSSSELQQVKKNFILDSFKINKAQKELKDWENDCRNRVIDTETVEYNETLGKISSINLKIGQESYTYEALSGSIALPKFIISRRTLETLNDESLLKIAQAGRDQLPRHVQLSDLFSLDSSSALPTPDFKRISQLINIEYRMRLEKRLKLELLTLIKQKLDNENRSWTKNLSYLNNFINKSVPEAIAEVEKIKSEENDTKLKKEQLESDESLDEEEVEIQEVEREEEEGEQEEVIHGHNIEIEEENVDDDDDDDDGHAKGSDVEDLVVSQVESHENEPVEEVDDDDDDMLIDH